MGISAALGSALQGLDVTSRALEVVSRNVANADTPGYTRKSLTPTSVTVGGITNGVLAGDVRREVDSLLVQKIRQENSGLGYVKILESYYGQVDYMYGEPGAATAIDTLYNSFQSAMEALVSRPEDYIAREQVLREAQVFAAKLNQMSDDIQALRAQAESEIGDTVGRINELLTKLGDVNVELAGSAHAELPPPALLDQRDGYLAELSELIDINITEADRGVVHVRTGSGFSLLDPTPGRLQFDERGTVSALSRYDPDSSESGVGTVRIITPNGGEIDLIQDQQIRSGKLAGLLEMRDRHLVDAQAQLDSIAHTLAKALSTVSVEGAAVTSGAQAGFDVDLGAMQPGDSVSITMSVNGVEQRVTLIGVENAATLPLGDDVTPDVGDRVVGIDLSGGPAAIAAQVSAALEPGIAASAPGGSVLRLLDDGDSQAASSGVAYGADGSTLDLSALNGESLTVSTSGSDFTFTFGAATTGQDLQAFIASVPGLSASIVAGDLSIAGDTADTGFSIAFSDPSVGTATGLAAASHNTSSLTAVRADVTATAAAGQGLGLPLFVDGVLPYTGSLDGNDQQIGFAGRISINPALLADNSLLVVYDSGVLTGDQSRPEELLRRLSDVDYQFSPDTRVAGVTPYEGTISGFIQRTISYQGAVASDIYQAAAAQETVSLQLNERFASESGVSIDQEMARLIELQTAYQANTRVITVFREMMDQLLRI